jgi:NAD(P)-dependent dehydrogenase (short-subunit alcohol dehydrogenase family)
MGLTGKVAIVTGGNSGIGRAIALDLAKQGAQVVINYVVNPEATAEMEKQIAAAGGRALGVKADVSKVAELQSLVDACVTAFGRVDILVNNAGIGFVGNIEETPLDDFRRLFRTNVEGVFLVTKAAIPLLRASHGSIINIGSVAGLVGVKRRAAYCGTKGAVIALTRQLALDYATEFRVNCIAPGTVDTPFVDAYLEKYHKHEKEKTREELHRRQPVGRMGKAEEIAGLAVYLASEESGFMTGSILPIDGGWTAA